MALPRSLGDLPGTLYKKASRPAVDSGVEAINVGARRARTCLAFTRAPAANLHQLVPHSRPSNLATYEDGAQVGHDSGIVEGDGGCPGLPPVDGALNAKARLAGIRIDGDKAQVQRGALLPEGGMVGAPDPRPAWPCGLWRWGEAGAREVIGRVAAPQRAQ